MLVEKEVISPGVYWYTDEKTGEPRKLVVTPELTKYWHDEGSKMLSAGLTIPVPYEHDFTAHPMTPKEKLLNNAGEVKEYKLKGNSLWSVVDVQDDEAKKKIGKSIRWTSPWINSFTDGAGQKWNNVITHLALTTRPRVTKQAPFGSIAAALSMASDTPLSPSAPLFLKEGVCLSIAGKLVRKKTSKRLRPKYPVAFSIFSGGVPFGEGDDVSPLRKKRPDDDSDYDDEYEDEPGGDDLVPDDGSEQANLNAGAPEPFKDPAGDVSMEELLCDLLGALGIHCDKTSDETAFKRSLYNAAMTKIHELTGKAQEPEQGNPNQSPGGTQPNPLIQQEQQPMYMSMEEINKLPEPMKGVALAMHAENQKLRAAVDASTKVTNSLREAKLTEARAARDSRVALLVKLMPRVKPELDAMLSLQSMALSMDDNGVVVDPMAQTLAVLEKGLADIPRLLTSDSSALAVQQQPTDAEMSQEAVDQTVESFARMMGAPPEKK